MMRFFYDLAFSLFGIFSLPHFLMRLKQAEDPDRLVRERFGIFSPDLVSRLEGPRPLWIHAVSVGEVLAVEKLIQLLLERRPEQRMVLTTVTPTGQRLARQWERDNLCVLYFPFDLQFAVRRFFETLRPAALLLIETEIWPNVIEEARARQVPVVVMNGRISERSFQLFRLSRTLFSPLLRKIQLFLVQTEKDRERLTALGVPREKVTVTGNMKLDTLDPNGVWKENRTKLRQEWGYQETDQILIAGSTHAGEEEILFRMLKDLRGEGFQTKLLIAPRHIERSVKILELAKRQGWKAVLASQRQKSSPEVVILDQLGKLRSLYAVADVVFMGGSLVRHGGQNPIEPAAVRRPIVHGPWVSNFHEIYRCLGEAGGSICVNQEEELRFVLGRLLASDKEREHLGSRAYEVLEKLRGATERNFKAVDSLINLREFVP